MTSALLASGSRLEIGSQLNGRDDYSSPGLASGVRPYDGLYSPAQRALFTIVPAQLASAAELHVANEICTEDESGMNLSLDPDIHPHGARAS